MGTPFYASPEQLNGDRPSVAMDIWAVGTLLYQMLAGEHPFRADDQVESYRLIREAEPPPLAAFCRAVPDGLEAIVRRALAKLPAERWDDARAMADALAPYEERGPA
jgi:serine/threonine-protein kinase